MSAICFLFIFINFHFSIHSSIPPDSKLWFLLRSLSQLCPTLCFFILRKFFIRVCFLSRPPPSSTPSAPTAHSVLIAQLSFLAAHFSFYSAYVAFYSVLFYVWILSQAFVLLLYMTACLLSHWLTWFFSLGIFRKLCHAKKWLFRKFCHKFSIERNFLCLKFFNPSPKKSET